MKRQINCAYCGSKFWSPTQTRYVVWLAKPERKYVLKEFDNVEDAEKFMREPLKSKPLEPETPKDFKKELDFKDGKYKVWLVHLDKIKTCSVLGNFNVADQFDISTYKTSNDQVKLIEKVDVIKENYCLKCRSFARQQRQAIKARMRREALEKMKKRGVKGKGLIVNTVKDEDVREYLKQLVNRKVFEDYQQQQESKKKEAMEKNRKVYKGETVNIKSDQNEQSQNKGTG